MHNTHELKRENELFMQYFKIGYSVTTATVLVAMTVTGVIQLFSFKHAMANNFLLQGVPQHIIYFLAITKLFCVSLFVLPIAGAVKEWAYAVFAYVLLFAIVINCTNGISPIQQCLLFLLLIVSYCLRMSILTDNGNPRLHKPNKANI